MRLRMITKPLGNRMYSTVRDECDVTLKPVVSERSRSSIVLTDGFVNIAVAFVHQMT
jgi:hypothetical protein